MTLPLFKTMHEDVIDKQHQRITELEAQLKMVLNDNTKIAQVRQSHNLRQQAKGIEDAVVNSPSRLKFSIPLVSTLELYNYVDTLNKQAAKLENKNAKE